MDSIAKSAIDPLESVPATGTVVADKYRVEHVVGTGGMGVVLAARHLQLGHQVAIKVLRPAAEQREEARERFLREGKAAARLTSDHVVKIYDVGELPDGTAYMVMELLRGRDLAKHVTEQGPLAMTEAVEFVLQSCDSIAEAHAAGIVHRDLKPANLFLTQRSDGSPLVKVLDFGISKTCAVADGADVPVTLTSTRTVIGSPAYMSPEQIRDAKHVDQRADIWALGLILYELLTGTQAFAADTLPAVCAAIAADDPIPVRQVRPEVPELLGDIVEKCLQKEPGRRFQTVGELKEALAMFEFRTAATARSGQLVSGARSKTPVHDSTMPSVAPDPDADTMLSGERVRIVSGPVSEPEASSTLKSIGAPPRPAPRAPARLVGPFGAVLGLVLAGLVGWLFLRPAPQPELGATSPSVAVPASAPATPGAVSDLGPTHASAAPTSAPEVVPAPDESAVGTPAARSETSVEPAPHAPPAVTWRAPPPRAAPTATPSVADAPGIRLER